MDGVAVAASSLRPPRADYGGCLLLAGAFAWIDTGDPMPPGTDTVVERERVRPRPDGGVTVSPGALVARGRNVRTGRGLRGEPGPGAGGPPLRPADLAAAAAGNTRRWR